MRKWAFFGVAGAIVVAGCGGTGGGSHPAAVAASNSKVPLSVRLSNVSGRAPGAIDVSFLTGQGQDTGLLRHKGLIKSKKLTTSAPGSLIALIQTIVLDDSYGEVSNPLAPIEACPLAGYQNNIVHLDVNFATQASGVASRLFPTYNLDFYGFDVAFNTTMLPEPSNFPEAYPASIRVFPGRSTSVPVFIDDSMFTLAQGGGSVVYNDPQFQLVNGLPGSPITGFLSDLVSFNISNLSPSVRSQLFTEAGFTAAGLTSQTNTVNYIMFSGDKIAVTDGNTAGSNIAMLTSSPLFSYYGNLGAASTISGPNGSLPSAGTYSMLTANPTDLTEMSKIISLQGIWRDSQTVLTAPAKAGIPYPALGAGTYYVSFPDSNDDYTQELVAFTLNSTGSITNLYYGNVNLVGTGNGPSFTLYPLADLVIGSVNGAVGGSISGMFTDDGQAFPTTSADLVKNGNLKFSGTPPAGLANGTFRVFRL